METSNHEICRCCLSENGRMKNMIEEYFKLPKRHKVHLIDGYSTCAGIEQNLSYSSPNICEPCEIKLTISYEFREQCQTSNQALLKRLDDNLLTAVKLETLSDEDPDIVYNDSASQQSHHFNQVFVVKGNKGSKAEPKMPGIKSEEVVIKPDLPDPDLDVESRPSKRSKPKGKVKRKSEPADDTENEMDDESSSKTFKCMASSCKLKYPTERKLRKHIAFNKHIPNDEYRCPYCGLGFKLFLPLQAHFKVEHDPFAVKPIFPCFKCKKICMIERFILEHTCDDVSTSVNPKSTMKNATYKCIRCAKVFEEEDALACHQHSVCLEDPKFICPVCGKVCLNQRRLTAHKRDHTTRIFICDECGYSVHSPHELTRHKVCHSTERNVKCPVCPAMFKNNHSLTKHQIIHVDRKYECSYCGKKFRTLDNVKSHLATHVNNEHMRKHTCEFCEKTFVRKRDRERHLRIHTDERPMKCRVCFKDFRDTGLMNEHYRRVHEGQYYECKDCNKRFSSSGRLKEHLFVHRGFSPYNCAQCPQKFMRKYLYVRHLLTHNIKYVESIHGYRETADMRSLMAESVRNPTHDSPNVSSEQIDNCLVLAQPPTGLPEVEDRKPQLLLYPNPTMNSSNFEHWNRPNIQPYGY